MSANGNDGLDLPGLLEKYGVPTTDLPTMLVEMTNLYETWIAAYKETKNESAFSDLSKQWKARPKPAEVLGLTDIIEPLAGSIYDNNPEDLAGLVLALEEITKYARELRDQALSNATRTEPTNNSVTKEEMEILSRGIRAHYNIVRMMKQVPEGYPEKQLAKSGEWVPDISKVQAGARAGKSGGDSKNERVLYYLDDEKIPCSLLKLKVQYGAEFDSANVLNLANEVTDGKASGGGWTVEIKGHKIHGRLVKGDL